MSAYGTNQTTSDVRLESAFGEERISDFGDLRAVDGPIRDMQRAARSLCKVAFCI